jgi:hypothetical protein
MEKTFNVAVTGTCFSLKPKCPTARKVAESHAKMPSDTIVGDSVRVRLPPEDESQVSKARTDELDPIGAYFVKAPGPCRRLR